MLQAEVLIVGGGPAGAAAAILAAQEGLRTVLLDNRPNDDKRPGETLHPGVEPLFRKLRVDVSTNAAAKIRHDGHWIRREGRLNFAKFGADQTGSWYGYQIGRGELRRILLDRASRAGATVRCLHAKRPVFRQTKICGVETSVGVIHCEILIDASGSSQWSARATAEPVNFLSPRLIAWYGWATSKRALQFASPIFTIGRSGWSWIAQVDHKTCAWTRLNFRGGPAKRLKKPALLEDFDAVEQERGADVTWRTVSLHAANGLFRVGDAGAVLDPAASQGALRAIMTGTAAAHSSVRILRYGHPPEIEASAFNVWVDRILSREADALRRLYGHRPALHR